MNSHPKCVTSYTSILLPSVVPFFRPIEIFLLRSSPCKRVFARVSSVSECCPRQQLVLTSPVRRAGLGVMLVEEGGADGEAGGDSPSSSAKLQLIGALRRGVCGGAARAHRFGWAAAWRLTGASPATRSLALLPPRALLACAVLLLAGAPPELCWRLTWRGCWCCDQGRRNLRPHLHPRRSRCAPLRSSRRPRRPAGPD